MRNQLISFALSFISESISASTDPVRLVLAAESAKWFRDLFISGGVVAFGCLLEILETVASLRKWFRARRGFEEKENPRSWGIPIAAIGLLLVIGGVVGEVVYEALSSNVDAKLQSYESEVLSAAETKAAFAEKQAGDANSLAAKNNKEAGQLRREAEAERLARLKLEEKVAWRTVSPNQLKILRNSLQKVSGPPIIVMWQMIDPEQANFGKQLAKALRKAGLSVNIVCVGESSEMENTAQISFWDVGPEEMDFAAAIGKALIAASLAKRPIPLRPPGQQMVGGDNLKVVVGPRNPI